MKNKLSVFCFALVVVIASCKKNDVAPANSSTNTISSVSPSSTSQWKSLSIWSTAKGNNVTTYSSKVADSSITADITKSGLVLAYFKNANGIQSLPYQEKDNSSFAYYQVSKGSLTFSVDNYSGSTTLNKSSFAYFIFTAEKLKNLRSSGYSKSKLMQMSYSDIANLLKS